MSGIFRTVDWLVLLVERGGPVMILLLALSVLSLAIILERAWFWLGTNRKADSQHLLNLNAALRSGDRKAVGKLIQRDRTIYGEVARSLLENGTTDAVAVEAVQNQRPRFERFMLMMSTIVTAAPLLGILGTVTGIIQSFRLLGEKTALTDPGQVSGGIAEALLNTALGLIIAIFTLFPYMMFRVQVERATGRLESLIAAAQQGQQEMAVQTSTVAASDTLKRSTAEQKERRTASAPYGRVGDTGGEKVEPVALRTE